MVDLDKMIADLKAEEAERLDVYDDATGKPLKQGDVLQGKLTTGTGHNLTDRGISKAVNAQMRQEDIMVAMLDLNKHTPWWVNLPEPAARGLLEMCFNMGWPRLSGFVNMLDALQKGNGARAKAEALSSRWADQVKAARAGRIADLLATAG